MPHEEIMKELEAILFDEDFDESNEIIKNEGGKEYYLRLYSTVYHGISLVASVFNQQFMDSIFKRYIHD